MAEISIYIPIIIVLAILLLIIIGIFTRYKRCPSDKVLVVTGKVGGNHTSKCIHGGTVFIMPVLQDYAYLDLTPFILNIDLKNVLTKQAIRVDIPLKCTLAISTEPVVVNNAAKRLLHKPLDYIKELAQDIIQGQIRLVIAATDVEELDSRQDKIIQDLTNKIENEIRKIGLDLININLGDVRDESGYLEALEVEKRASLLCGAKIREAAIIKEETINNKIDSITTDDNTTTSTTLKPVSEANGLSAEILDKTTLLIKQNNKPFAKLSIMNITHSNDFASLTTDYDVRTIDMLSSNKLSIQRDAKEIMKISFEPDLAR